jgi:beta-lactamase regulating signal transducer with metallopeptidase domain
VQPSLVLDVVKQILSGSVAPVANALHAFSQTAAPVAVTALWQGIGVALGLAICLKFAPRITAAHRFAVWATGFVVLAGLQFLPLLSSVVSIRMHSSVPSAVSASSTGPWLLLDLRWSEFIAALWIVASFLRAAELFIHSLRLHRLWKSAVPVNLTIDFRFTSGTSGHRRFEVSTTQDLDRPSVIGFFAPRILIPDWLLARLTPGELDQIVMHEAEHLRRRDDWTNLFQKFCLVLFPLDPALWWMERRLSKEREMACDEGVVRITHAPRAYAACLASLAERGLHRRAEALSLGAWQRRPELVHRVHTILRHKRALHPLASRALIGGLACTLLVVALEFARCPQLVAFVPPQKLSAAAAIEPLASPAEFLDSAPTAIRQAPGFYAVQTRAEWPATSQSKMTVDRPRLQRATQRKSAIGESRMLPSEFDVRSPRARAQEAKQQVAPVDAANDQQWIVLTSWEEVQTPDQTANTAADYDTTSNDASTTEPNTRPSLGASHITITRLVLRILPANPRSTQPAALRLENGWFVIQL